MYKRQALLCDGIGDTIRVSLTEAPEHEIPVAELLVRHFAERPGTFPVLHPERYSPTEYRRRTNIQVPVVHSEPCLLYTSPLVEDTFGERPVVDADAQGDAPLAAAGDQLLQLPAIRAVIARVDAHQMCIRDRR